MLLVETVWVGSKATRERVEGVVVVVIVLVLALVPVFHVGYYVDHYHHCCHHHHQLLRLPTIERSPNYEGSELPKTRGDYPCGACALLWKAFGTLDYPSRRGTRHQRRRGVRSSTPI